ncbi:hypothetical protein KAS42_01560 [bacterium]|nr:hypothetical protein [bacterium]
MKAIEFDGKLNDFLSRYKYQAELTKQLDNLDDIDFTQRLVNEIVLWKINRYVSINDEILSKLIKLKTLTNGKHRERKESLELLLQTHGIDLAMASTILRFRNPRAFQIIDKHAYRAIYDKSYPLHSTTPVNRKIDVYFDYLDKLIELCKTRGLEFQTVDRLLYVFDKEVNRKL